MSRRRFVLSVGELPEDVRELLVELSQDEQLGLKVAIFIARFRKRNHVGPTFSETFGILDRVQSSAIDWDASPDVTYAFRHHLAVHLRRHGWVRWNLSMRSLSTGRAFQIASATFTAKAVRAGGKVHIEQRRRAL